MSLPIFHEDYIVCSEEHDFSQPTYLCTWLRRMGDGEKKMIEKKEEF